eukprot:1404124-Amphidinium_carterae.1
MQTHELLLSKLLVPEEAMTVHFISHEWLGFRHPDPQGTQLCLMQRIFQMFVEGEAKSLFHPRDWEAFLNGFSSGTAASLRAVEQDIMMREAYEEDHLPEHVTAGYVWLDYHSIPQDKSNKSFLDAVNSIPHYVERCNYFWVCAPPAVHQDMSEFRDYTTWKGRGWCRLEEAANLFSHTLKMPLVVSNDTRLTTYGWLDRMMSSLGRPERSVGNGKFTCCHFKHKLKQKDGSEKTIPCDKDAIAPVLAL